MLNDWLFTTILIICAPGIYSMTGGIEGVPGEFNYVVSIWYDCEYMCSGVIIDEKHVLTTAHCLHDSFTSKLVVVAGRMMVENQDAQVAKEVDSVWLHPHSRKVFKPLEPNTDYWTNDIAVIKLRSELIWSPSKSFVNVVCGNADWNALREFVIPGWYHSVTAGQQAMSLAWTHGTIMSKMQCLQRKTNLLPNEECISAPVIMNRDDGSPLIYDNALIGMVIGGGTSPNNPITALTITPYLEFIMTAVTDDQTPVDPTDFRYVVSIWRNGTINCGGIIIDSSHILTAGHCVRGVKEETFRIVAARSDVNGYLDPTIEWLEIDRIKWHPDYKQVWFPERRPKRRILHDIAVVKLKKPLVLSSTLQRAVLMNAIDCIPELYYKVARWEHSNIADITLKIRLKWSSAIIHPQATKYVDLVEKQFIVVGANSLSISNPESYGNPVVCNGAVIGIIAHSFSYERRLPFVPTVVLATRHYISFIRAAISNN